MQYESAVNCGWYVGTLSEAEIKIKYIHNQIWDMKLIWIFA